VGVFGCCECVSVALLSVRNNNGAHNLISFGVVRDPPVQLPTSQLDRYYYLIILQYRHTNNYNKAQLVIFIKDIMYYIMDPSCANTPAKIRETWHRGICHWDSERDENPLGDSSPVAFG
jgi:hypothetical protein